MPRITAPPIGLIASQRRRPNRWPSNTRQDAASLFGRGPWMLETIVLDPTLLDTLLIQLQNEGPNWGSGRYKVYC